MTPIPAIGAARGLFEIFVPGVFFVINAGLALYLFPLADADTKRLLLAAASSPAIAAVVALCFGYLVGVLLRLYRCEWADACSGWWIRRFNLHAQLDHGLGYKLFATEEFPYLRWMREVCQTSLPPSAVVFFEATWADRIGKPRNRQYFNFCKAIVAGHDVQAGSELYAAESLSRYISGMLYALVAACALMVIDSIVPLFLGRSPMAIAPVLAVSYACAVVAILARYRFMRIKEVELLFAACYRNRAVFLEAGAVVPGGLASSVLR